MKLRQTQGDADADSESESDGIRRPQIESFGLRTRVTASFAVGALILSLILSFTTYLAVRITLVEQRETVAARQTYVNARLVRSGLRATKDVSRLLGSLENPTGSDALIMYENNWYASRSSASESTLPTSMRTKVINGQPAIMRFQTKEGTKLAVGIPIPSISASYFEVSTLNDVERTLRTLEVALICASVITTLLGFLLGQRVGRMVIHPVTEAAAAAETIALGNLDTRLSRYGDSDLDRLVHSFNRMVDALQERLARDARFASDVSHELRSPLMTLASGVTVLQSRRQELPPRSQIALDLLTDEIERFQKMVQDLLEISRTDAGHVDFSLEEVLAGEFVRNVVARYERDIPIDAQPGVEDSILAVDKRRMVRVIGNLIENADRYAGGVTRIGLEWAGKNIRIVIDDEGPGIPLDERGRIFERFSRGTSAKARASGEGTGLGLSLVDEHVRLHHGKVWVEDRPGGGARFVVELPRIME